jgi:hypothetical protein
MNKQSSTNPRTEDPQEKMTVTHSQAVANNIPTNEKKVWHSIQQLPHNQKKLLWQLIKTATKDNIALYQGKKQDLRLLLQMGFIVENLMFPSKRLGVSLFVLPNSPYLMRELKALRTRK